MKGEPFHALSLASILFITHHWTTFVGKMDPDLILPAGQQLYFQQTVPG